ncbi:class I SAM-dependent methyltransferase [Mumia sp. zg.B17]|uniref:class I SAM-dependent methyltransferase n=1 Tax=Mumia sp. zg.B17 TaxID=2855446 RepID=UPI001C6EA414|nr:class I SAM-dependent methyltransferase [Mumia sp. zg.B17]MBW9206336.1 class I SAM-dependent methyltransferase [Mumia sp. zg.B17]
MRTQTSAETAADQGRRAVARSLVASWERQQEAYIAHRETRFDLMLDLVERLSPSGPDRPRILDLACGPGSLSARVLDRFPHADVVAVDLDPLLLTLGRLDHADRERQPTWVRADLRDPGWTGLLPVAPYDAIVSTTALHWLTDEQLATLYRQLYALLVPDGLFLNGDYLPASRPWGAIATVVREIGESRKDAAISAGADDWETWWSAVRATPELAEEVADHDATFEGTTRGDAPSLELHVRALRDGGFAEVELVWHDLTEGLLCALKTGSSSPAQ